MSAPSKIVGGGNNSIAINVLKVLFSEATTDIPVLEAWDDYGFNTTLIELFTGTTINGNIPLLAAVATTDGAPSSDWVPASPVAGGATANRLKGNTNYVNLASAALAADDEVLFNLSWEVPADVTIPSNLSAVITIKFSYSGSAPILTWSFNDNQAGGTEGTPVWTVITPGVEGNTIQPADAGAVPGAVVLHRPPSGVIDCGEIWVV